MREYKKLLDTNPDWVDIYTIEEFDELRIEGWIKNYDGNGYWVKNGYESRDEVFSTPSEDATHVAWYNK